MRCLCYEVNSKKSAGLLCQEIKGAKRPVTRSGTLYDAVDRPTYEFDLASEVAVA
jgi:hypothetical protein